MTTGTLHIDLEAIAANWRALDAMSRVGCETGATVKADAYGLGLAEVARRLLAEGCRAFFVASASEGLDLRRVVGPEPRIYVFYGHMAGDTDLLQRADLVPLLVSLDQLTRHLESLPRKPFGVQLDTGMNRLGLKMSEWTAAGELALAAGPVLLMSHLHSSTDPGRSAEQLARFREMTDGLDISRSLAATGGVLLGPEFQFDIVRPGIGLYGAAPFVKADPVVALDLPVIACFDIAAGETVGYDATWRAACDTRVATVAGGYADGIFRALSPGLEPMAGPVACPVIGRVSMDSVCLDIGHLESDPETVRLLDAYHGVDIIADQAGTIGYEILTNLGRRYRRTYRGRVSKR